MISLVETLIVFVAVVGLVGFTVFKSRLVRLAIGILMAVTVGRAVFGYFAS